MSDSKEAGGDRYTVVSRKQPAANSILPPPHLPANEIVHLHIVKLLHHNPNPGAPPFEVLDVVEGPAQPYLETVRVYPNQMLPPGQSPAEREQTVRQ